MYSIYLIIEISIVKHPNKRAIAKLGHVECFDQQFQIED